MEEQQFFFCLFCGVPNTTRKHLPEDQDLKKKVPKVLRCWCFERVDVQVSSVSLVGCFDGTSWFLEFLAESKESWKSELPSGEPTWQLKSTIFNRRYIFKRSLFSCHVSFPEGTPKFKSTSVSFSLGPQILRLTSSQRNLEEMDVFLYYWEDEEAVECAYWMGAGVLKVQNECDGDHLVAFKRKQVVFSSEIWT